MGKFSVGKILASGWRWYVGEQQLALANSMRLARCAVLLEIFVLIVVNAPVVEGEAKTGIISNFFCDF